MYEELIAQLNPIPKLNLNWYKNEDLYSEGDIEDEVIQLIAQYPPEDYTDAICQNFSWSSYYHLTFLRKNILNWYPFKKDANVLEIGCGMGAITGLLCDSCKSVTSVELSQRRAIATLLRCREKENLEIIVGNLNDITFDKKFDYITLIGVLEYQGSYTETDNPYGDFLKKIKNLLAPDGKLLIAIENQYGLKYWCGAREDHTGFPFDGMNQYSLSNKKVRTFSKEALDQLIKSSGFENTYFYYPLPDYKLPTVIYSQNHLPQNTKVPHMACYYIPNSATLVAREEDIYKDIIENKVFDFFANSFLVECSNDSNVGEITFASLSSERMPEYRIGTRFTQQGTVEKFPLDIVQGFAHIKETMENEIALATRNINIWNNTLIDNKLVANYSDAPLLESVLIEAFRQNDIDRVYSILDRVYDDILKSSEASDWQGNILYTFGLDIEPDQEKFGPILKIGYLDMIPRNAFWIEDAFHWFDQEWILENVPAKYILYRGIKELYASFDELHAILPFKTIIEHYNLSVFHTELELIDNVFMNLVLDMKHLKTSVALRNGLRENCLRTIKRILEC